MKSNIEKAVAGIATLSFLLGLSLGQIHQQKQQLQQQGAAFQSAAPKGAAPLTENQLEEISREMETRRRALEYRLRQLELEEHCRKLEERLNPAIEEEIERALRNVSPQHHPARDRTHHYRHRLRELENIREEYSLPNQDL